MNELRAQLREWRAAIERRLPPWWPRALAVLLIVFGLVLPQLFSATNNFVNTEILALTYVMFALGLNIVVGFAGLLDLGYVAFFALGSYAFGWLGSGWFFKAHVHVLAHGPQATLPGIHLNFVLILICAGLSDRIRRRHHRRADAAVARRLHRDRDARVRGDHPGVRAPGTVAEDLRDAADRWRARDQRRPTRPTSRGSARSAS